MPWDGGFASRIHSSHLRNQAGNLEEKARMTNSWWSQNKGERSEKRVWGKLVSREGTSELATDM